MKRIGYILFNESLSSGLIQSQVLNLLKSIDNDYEIYLFNFVPIYKLIDLYKIQSLRKELKKYNVNIVFLPITIPSKLFIFNSLYILLSYIYSIVLFLLTYLFKIDILHCRSYFSTLLGVKCKRLNSNLSVIFDTRSLFIEENISLGNIDINSSVYKKWKKTEKEMLINADKVVVINKFFIRYFSNYIDYKKISIIPIFVDEKKIYFDKSVRDNYRNKLQLKNKDVVIYTGSFYGWNDPDLYANYFRKLINHLENPYLLIITRQKNRIENSLKKNKISKKHYHITSCDHLEIKNYLSASDYGIIVMNKNVDSDTRLGVKFVEYLATGLTVLTNSNVGAAESFVIKEECGFVIEDNKDFKNIKLLNRNKIINSYKDNFSKKIILSKYEKIYFRL